MRAGRIQMHTAEGLVFHADYNEVSKVWYVLTKNKQFRFSDINEVFRELNSKIVRYRGQEFEIKGKIDG